MSKSNPWRSRVGRASDVNVIDSTVRGSSTRRAKIAFLTTLLIGWALASVVAWQLTIPVLAVIVGLAVAFCAAFVIGLLVWIWPILRIIVHWFTELLMLGALLTGFASLSTVITAWQAALVTVGSVGGLYVFPPLRDKVNALTWCLISRHRLRMSFSDYIRGNRTGSLPFILWAKPTPVGERVWVWLRPGLSLTELEGRGDLLAVSCWSRQVTVNTASDKYSALLRFDIKRRDTFTGTIASPLHLLVPGRFTKNSSTPQLSETSGLALDLVDVPVPADPASTENGTHGKNDRRRSKPADTDPEDPSAPDQGPDDLDDWI